MSRLSAAVSVAVIITLTACAPDPYHGPYSETEMVFSDELDRNFIEEVVHHFQNYLAESGIDTVVISTTQTFKTFSDIDLRRRGESFTIYVSRRTPGMNYNGCYHNDGTSLLPLTDFRTGEPFSPRTIAQTALHELGHACGHPHVPAVSAPKGNIMADVKLNNRPLAQPLTPSHTPLWAEEQLPALMRCFYG